MLAFTASNQELTDDPNQSGPQLQLSKGKQSSICIIYQTCKEGGEQAYKLRIIIH